MEINVSFRIVHGGGGDRDISMRIYPRGVGTFDVIARNDSVDSPCPAVGRSQLLYAGLPMFGKDAYSRDVRQ